MATEKPKETVKKAAPKTVKKTVKKAAPKTVKKTKAKVDASSKLRIKVSAYEHKLLDESVSKIIEAAARLGIKDMLHTILKTDEVSNNVR